MSQFLGIYKLWKSACLLGLGNPTTPLHSNTTKREVFFDGKKTVKIAKRSHAFKGYASSYNVIILSSFNPELQLKDTKPAIKNK